MKLALMSVYVVAAALLGAASISLLFWPQSAQSLAMYQREQAHKGACKAAAVAISTQTGPSPVFVDDCVAPNITKVAGQVGVFIVTRVVEGKTGADYGVRRTYSVMLDGSRTEGWLTLGVKQAPNLLQLDASLLLKAQYTAEAPSVTAVRQSSMDLY